MWLSHSGIMFARSQAAIMIRPRSSASGGSVEASLRASKACAGADVDMFWSTLLVTYHGGLGFAIIPYVGLVTSGVVALGCLEAWT